MPQPAFKILLNTPGFPPCFKPHPDSNLIAPGTTGAGNNYDRLVTTKTAVRNVAAPIADLTFFIALIQGILDTNPWGCTSYQAAGQTMPALAKTREAYSGRIVFENDEAKTVGQISVKAPTAASYHECKHHCSKRSPLHRDGRYPIP